MVDLSIAFCGCSPEGKSRKETRDEDLDAGNWSKPLFSHEGTKAGNRRLEIQFLNFENLQIQMEKKKHVI